MSREKYTHVKPEPNTNVIENEMERTEIEILRHLKQAGVSKEDAIEIMSLAEDHEGCVVLKIAEMVNQAAKEVSQGAITPDEGFTRIMIRMFIPKGPQVSEEEAHKIREYREDGYSIRQIANVFQRSTETIHRLTKDIETKQTP
jgi:hypothetical protein